MAYGRGALISSVSSSLVLLLSVIEPLCDVGSARLILVLYSELHKVR